MGDGGGRLAVAVAAVNSRAVSVVNILFVILLIVIKKKF